jgi:hypothetical protein
MKWERETATIYSIEFSKLSKTTQAFGCTTPLDRG